MKKIFMDREEKEAAARWIEDEGWVKKKCYADDRTYISCVKDILEHPVFNQMEEYIQHGNTTCRTHCIQVSYMCYSICRRAGLDYKSAARAALLHDLFLYDWHTHARETGDRFHGFTHPRAAMKNASEYFVLSEKEKNMILRHMWPLTPIPPASMEGFVLLYADKFCSCVETGSRMKTWIGCKMIPKHL